MTFETIAARWGFSVSSEKTKMMSMGSPEGNLSIQLEFTTFLSPGFEGMISLKNWWNTG